MTDHVVNIDDSIGLADSGIARDMALTLVDDTGITDTSLGSPLIATGFVLTVDDELNLDDSGESRTFGETITDTVGLVDSQSFSTGGSGSQNFTITITDSVGLNDADFFLIGGSAPEPAVFRSPVPIMACQIAFDAAPDTTGYFRLDDPIDGLLNGAAPLAVSQTWSDVSQYLLSGTIERGSERLEQPLPQYAAGTTSIRLRNDDRRFDPTNLDGPYVVLGQTQVEPMRGLRLFAIWNSSTYDLFQGFIDAWDVGYFRPFWSEANVTATDAFKYLRNYDRIELGTPVGDGELPGERINRILDDALWPVGQREIADGQTILQGTLLGGTSLDELQTVSDSEAGELYVDPRGNVVFRGRDEIVNEPRSAMTQATFGDDPSADELPYHDVTLVYDEATLVNVAQIGREGGTVQVATNDGSVSRYLTRAYNNTNLAMQSDSDALLLAQYIVGLHGTPELRFTELVLKPLRDPDVLFPQALGRRVGDRITVVRRPPGGGDPVIREVYIRGIKHEFTPESWVTTWQLSAINNGNALILDHPTLGALNTGRLAF